MDFSRYSAAAKLWALRSRAQIGPRQMARLLAEFQTVDNILESGLRESLSTDSSLNSAAIPALTGLDESERFIEALEAFDIKTSSLFDLDYPQGFTELNDPPSLFFYQGRLPTAGEKIVALVGSRQASAEGIATAVRFGKAMAEQGTSIVSGLRVGIDAAAHVGAITAGGHSYGILASGHNAYDVANYAELPKQISVQGAVISEYAPVEVESVATVVAANRLIVGLSQAVVIGEVSAESIGAIDVARCCNELGKILFCLVSGDEHDEKTFAAVAEHGAIPLRFPEDAPVLLKCLV